MAVAWVGGARGWWDRRLMAGSQMGQGQWLGGRRWQGA